MELESIWNGWEKQCFYRGSHGDARCAAIYPNFSADSVKTFDRVAKYLRVMFALPDVHIHEVSKALMRPQLDSWDAIVYANNVLKLTPEQFREIDRATQLAEGMAAVERLVDSVEVADGITA